VATAEPGVTAASPGPTGQAGQASDSADRPGDQAELPTPIPPKGWWQVTRRAFTESSADNVGILAGGIAYAAFLAIPPALIAGMSLFGLVADPATIAQQAEGVLAALPESAQPLIRDQIVSLTQTSSGALSERGLTIRPHLSVERYEQPDDRDQHRLRRVRAALPQARGTAPCSPSRDVFVLLTALVAPSWRC
jgi:hypothetical protein